MQTDCASISFLPAHRLGATKSDVDIRAEPLVPLDVTDPFAAAVRETRMPMVITDPHAVDNPIVFANKAFCNLTGYRLEEIIGRNCRFLQGPETDPLAVARIFKAVQAEQPIEIEIRNYRKDGSPFWNRVLITPVHNAAGALVYFFANQIDVSAEHERIAELQNHNRALTEAATVLEQRTNELIEASERLQAEVTERERMEVTLQQLHKMKAIGQLTGGIAHDFNNLIGGIIGSLELLQRSIATGRPDELERYATAATASAKRAASLTQRLLAFARRQPLKPKPTDASRLVTGMEDLLQRTLGPTIDIKMSLAHELQPCLCDPNLLENAILNLAINARDAMPGGGCLTIKTANACVGEGSIRIDGSDLKPGQYVMISVTDTGTGMTPAVVARAFEPFFTTKPVGEGTGLGLSMVYGFVKQSEGHVQLHSKPGRGTTFKLYLPCYRDGLADDPTETLMPLAAAPRSQAAETVLVVDDEETFRMVVKETLQALGYKIIEAADGLSALQILRSDIHIDLLVTDIGLPGLGGHQLAGAARQVRPTLPVLFITGYTNGDTGDSGPPLNAEVKVLNKPFTLHALGKTVQDLLTAM